MSDTTESERFQVLPNGEYGVGVWDHDRDQWAITDYSNADGLGMAAAQGAAQRMNDRAVKAAERNAR